MYACVPADLLSLRKSATLTGSCYYGNQVYFSPAKRTDMLLINDR